mmetsp:Transcript_8617/g.8745  ORF Transcript_8617/g.8745 Transcript_8617/m.8745 type:complete len:295 (+) Transcript_8617:530-1414(+)
MIPRFNSLSVVYGKSAAEFIDPAYRLDMSQLSSKMKMFAKKKKTPSQRTQAVPVNPTQVNLLDMEMYINNSSTERVHSLNHNEISSTVGYSTSHEVNHPRGSNAGNGADSTNTCGQIESSRSGVVSQTQTQTQTETAANMFWIQVAEACAQIMRLMEQMLSLGSLLLGPAVGVIGSVLRQLLQCLVSAAAQVTEKDSVSASLRVASRALLAVAGSRELIKHAGQICATLIDGLITLELTSNVKELLLPGIFALIDKCEIKQRKQMSAVLDIEGASLLRDLYDIYFSDYKFIGKA